jgi:hypothetical protein
LRAVNPQLPAGAIDGTNHHTKEICED